MVPSARALLIGATDRSGEQVDPATGRRSVRRQAKRSAPPRLSGLLQGTSGAGVTAKIYQPLLDYLRARFRRDLLRKSTSSSPAI